MVYLIPFVFISQSLFTFITAFFRITDEVIPSYLYGNITVNEDDLFPRELKINMSLNKVKGTLWYSIDKQGNQLIISLQDDVEPTISVEFKNNQHILTFQNLCGCVVCKYMQLSIHLVITELIKIKCNERKEIILLVTKNKNGLNQAYPSLPSQNLYASYWLVNTPTFGDIFSNNEQLDGCIFDIFINNKTFTSENFGRSIKKKCDPICKNEICNKGLCYETYSHEPVCNCDKTFRNGKNCRQEFEEIQNPFILVNVSLMFHNLKLSWKSNSNKIMTLKNSNLIIQIYTEENKLKLLYNYNDNLKTSIEGTIVDKYNNASEFILILHFKEKEIIIQDFNINHFQKIIIPTNIDLSKHVFKKLEALNLPGRVDIAYKTFNKDSQWKSLRESIKEKNSDLHKNVITKNSSTISITKNKKLNEVKIICIVILFLILVAQIIFIIHEKCRKKKMQKKRRTENSDMEKIKYEDHVP